jgi:FkbM family methyltransferase
MDAMAPKLLTTARSLGDLLRFDRFIAVGANSGGDQVCRWLAERGKRVLAYADLSPTLQNIPRNGLDVLAPIDCLALLDARTAFVIGTVRQREAADVLTVQLGIDPQRVFGFINPMFAAHYEAGAQERLAPQLPRIRALLSDAASRDYFDRVTAFNRTMDPRHLTPQPRRIGQYGYDAPGANPPPGAAIVDCGAFTGDSFAGFLTATKGSGHIYALEAFPPNFERLTANIARDGLQAVVTPLAVAAGRQAGTIRMSGDEAIADGCAHVGAARHAPHYDVACDTLDNLFAHTRIDYLKMDIEGADLDALIGGRRLLRECRPVVAVAAYHTPEHIVGIADFLCETLGPCRLYAAHDPNWVFHIHYIAVPDNRAA